nr:AAA family ATPase [Robbsia betulipollinis]
MDALLATNERNKAARKVSAARDEFIGQAKPAAAKPANKPSVMLSCAADITPEAIVWLWPGWLPAGKLTILAGSPGTGKTTLALSLAAAVSKGSAWPDGTRHATPGTVLMWSSEDDPADTLVPRLMAADANLRNIQFIRQTSDVNGELQPFDPSRDIPLLGERLEQMGGAQLLILDPIISAVAGDAHRVNDVRRDLQALVDMAGAYRCAVLGISHFAKGGKGTSPAERVIGSQAFVALARMVLVAAKDEAAERRILARAKSNIAPDDGGIAYTLEQVTMNHLEASRVVWGEAITGSARDILGDVEETDDDEKTEIDEAGDFLRSILASGPVPVKALKADATGAGYSWRTIERAKREIGAQARKGGMKDGWTWVLPLEGRQDRHEESQSPGDGGLHDSWRSSSDTGGLEAQNTANIHEGREDRHVQESGNLPESSAPDADMEV